MTEKLLMARNFLWIFTENKPAQGPKKIQYCQRELVKHNKDLESKKKKSKQIFTQII